jgi:exopolyphosphatase / guanosine-5'-triphosphate,3'-diphosphate pyrophosphatase
LKFAAIDIGSNAIRLLIEEVYTDQDKFHIEKVSLTRVPVRLGEDVFSKGKISKEKTRQLIKSMQAFWNLMEVHNVEIYRACATSAMREAKNKKEIIAKVLKESKIDIEVLTGAEEARLIFSNSAAQNLRPDLNYLYIDVGGGSTELTLIKNGKKIKSKSFAIGTVRMLVRGSKPSQWKKIQEWVQGSLASTDKVTAIGTGGNINTMFKIQGKKPSELITYDEIKVQYKELTSISIQERIIRMRMKPDRADVIIPAAEIYLRIMEYGNISSMMVPKIGLSDGMILDMFETWKENLLEKEKKKK